MNLSMKKIKFMLVVMAVMFSIGASAQYGIKSNSTRKSTKDTLVTNSTYTTSTGTWKIIINKKSGSCYYWCKTKDGRLAKRYCPKEVSAEVSAKNGIKYTPRNK